MAARTDQIQIYRSRLRRWRWRYVHANGHILADSGQGYSRRIDCLNGAKAVCGLRDGEGEVLVGFGPEWSYRVVRLVETKR